MLREDLSNKRELKLLSKQVPSTYIPNLVLLELSPGFWKRPVSSQLCVWKRPKEWMAGQPAWIPGEYNPKNPLYYSAEKGQSCFEDVNEPKQLFSEKHTSEESDYPVKLECAPACLPTEISPTKIAEGQLWDQQ